MQAKEIVIGFWQAMNSNDFLAASEWLSEDIEILWPMSSEKIVGRANFVALNANYPAQGNWIFTLNTLVAEAERVVSDVSVTDGVVKARAISFFTITNNQISSITEFWPEPYDPPAGRSQWVERVRV